MRDMARSFADEVFAPNAVAWDEARHFPVTEMRKAAALGMGGVYIAEDVGGSGLSRLTATLIFEALASGCPTVAAYISIHNLVAWMIDAHGTDTQRKQWLPKTMHHGVARQLLLDRAGRRLRRGGAHDTRDARRRPLCDQRPGSNFISGAGSGDLYAVMARTGGDGAIRHLDLDRSRRHAGHFVRCQRCGKMGWNAQPTRAVVFENVRVSVANRLGAEGIGFKIAMAGLDGGRLNIAACSLGGAQKGFLKWRSPT